MSTKWERRDKKRRKRRFGMRVSGRSLLLLDRLMGRKAKKRKKDTRADGVETESRSVR